MRRPRYDTAYCRLSCTGYHRPVGTPPHIRADPIPAEFVVWHLGSSRCSSSHWRSIGLQSCENGGWCNIVTPSCSIKSRTILAWWAGGYHLESKICRQVFPWDVQCTAAVTLRSRITNWDLPPAWKTPQTSTEPPHPAMVYYIHFSWRAFPWSLLTLTRTPTLCKRYLDSYPNNTWRQWLTVTLQWALANRRRNHLWRGVRCVFLQPLFESLRDRNT